MRQRLPARTAERYCCTIIATARRERQKAGLSPNPKALRLPEITETYLKNTGLKGLLDRCGKPSAWPSGALRARPALVDIAYWAGCGLFSGVVWNGRQIRKRRPEFCVSLVGWPRPPVVNRCVLFFFGQDARCVLAPFGRAGLIQRQGATGKHERRNQQDYDRRTEKYLQAD